MNEIEEARKKEIRDQWKMLPLVVVLFVLFVGLYVVLLQESVYIRGEQIWGATKGIWFIVVIALGGLAIAFICLSASVIFYIGMIAINLNTKAHPWKPLMLSVGILVLGYSILSMALYAESFVREHADVINSWYEYRIGEGFIHWIVSGVWLHGVIFLTLFLLGVIVICMKLPFWAKDHANFIKDRKKIS
ncbi:hypothetical protein [Teredinibacter sp. KSP-S5-2]|uniref:hypothetical protein n=1 Tax=Teredinibacter sp. KSP-S5-2 TaxID=3034506 RepID=UPI00293522B8|nr:hypothetical protein [Teredinibacter sp. KSP-S5-2]WNO11649.1 hypothetical protein P5V12_10745 [Teredinibacter sp. KSP-S5-2]